jgi:3-oxoacyl-[acyl-carrier-protein] synthase II
LFGVLAAREAWNDAGLSFAEPNAGVIIGSGGGGIDVGEQQYRDFFQNNGQHVSPYAIAVGICGMVSSEISIALGLRGISHVLSTGCTSSTDALGYAVDAAAPGRIRRVVVGRHRRLRPARHDLRLLAHARVSTHFNDCPAEASRPFDRCRDGFVLGEGSWMMALELEDRARARGAEIYATIEGYASTCDAYHRVQMDPDGEQIVKCMQDAVAKAGRSPEEIGYINYHGTSTQLNDAIESRCTRLAFGKLADGIPGSSTKSMIGHPQGASGSAGVVATALALSRNFLPPTINQTAPDPDCDLDFIPNRGRDASPVAALCNCLGFGSKNSALVLGRADSPQRANGARRGPPTWMTSPLRERARPAPWPRPFSRRPACASACSIARAFRVINSAAIRSTPARSTSFVVTPTWRRSSRRAIRSTACC